MPRWLRFNFFYCKYELYVTANIFYVLSTYSILSKDLSISGSFSVSIRPFISCRLLLMMLISPFEFYLSVCTSTLVEFTNMV